MKKKDFAFLSETFLFSGIEAKEILSLPCEITPQALQFKKGERLDFSFSEEKKLAFVLTGECEVMRDKVVLNTLRKGDSFCILSIF